MLRDGRWDSPSATRVRGEAVARLALLSACILPVALLMPVGKVLTQSSDETVSETVLTSTDIRSGFVSGRTFVARPVSYAVVDGLAVVEGDIILGTVEEMESVAARVRLLEALAGMPKDEDLGYLAERSIRRLMKTLGNIDSRSERRWPDATIPYVIDPILENPERVIEAMKHWADTTRVRFVARDSTHREYVYFVKDAKQPTACASSVGMKKGGQKLFAGSGCTVGNVIHEIGHAIGLWHEHGRKDRDKHIMVDFANVATENHKQFIQSLNESDDQGIYDFGSIMHYGAHAFALDSKKPSIVPLASGVTIGQRVRPSKGDIAAVAAMYPLLDD